MRAGILGEISVWIMDLVALLALAGTGEVHMAVLGSIGFLFLVSRIFAKRAFALSNGLLVAFLALTISGALGAWLIFKMPLILGVAQAAPFLHGSLWFGGQRNRERVWRIAVGFVELNIAAVLTAEVYLAPMIFLFALVASIAISAGFLESTSRIYDRSDEPVRLPRSYLFSVMGISFLILMTSFVIFPILPRVRTSAEMDIGTKRTGYTEEVSLSNLASPSGSGEGQPVLSFFLPEGESSNVHFTTLFYLGLVRSRALAVFDGSTWQPDRRPSRLSRDRSPAPRNEIVIEAIRQPLSTDSLPSPYGTLRIREASPAHLQSGEWVTPYARDRRISYSVVLERDQVQAYGSLANDVPTELHLHVPERLATKGMRGLVKKLFSPVMSSTEKVASLQRYFVAQKFSPSTEEGTPLEGTDFSSRLHPLENFLFVSKKGHCELFSGSAALLLRMAGVPTRLVAGFRISREPMGGVLTLRSGDAHAWVEYWIPEKGWKALDLTPRMIASGSSWDYLRRLYEAGSAFWYKNVSSFDSDQQIHTGYQAIRSLRVDQFTGSARKKFSKWASLERATLLWIAIYSALLGLCGFLVIRTWFPWILSIRWKVNQGPSWIKRERIRMEQLLARRLYGQWLLHPNEGLDFGMASKSLIRKFGDPAARSFSSWEEIYLRARFGASGGSRGEMLRELRARRRELASRLS